MNEEKNQNDNDELHRMMKEPGRREPPQSLRTAAHFMADMYASLVQQGFTENQALTIIGHVLSSSIAKDQHPGGPGTEGDR